MTFLRRTILLSGEGGKSAPLLVNPMGLFEDTPSILKMKTFLTCIAVVALFGTGQAKHMLPQNMNIYTLMSIFKNKFMSNPQQQQQFPEQQNQNPVQTPVYRDPQQQNPVNLYRQQQPVVSQPGSQNMDIPTLISMLKNLYKSNPQQQQDLNGQNQYPGQPPIQFREQFQPGGQQQQQFGTNGQQLNQNPDQTPVYPDPQQQNPVNPYRQQPMQATGLSQPAPQNIDIPTLISMLKNIYKSNPQQQQSAGQNQYPGQPPIQLREQFQPRGQQQQQQFGTIGQQLNKNSVQTPVYPDPQQQNPVNPYHQQPMQSIGLSQPEPSNMDISTVMSMLQNLYNSDSQQQQQLTGQNQFPGQIPMLQNTEQFQPGGQQEQFQTNGQRQNQNPVLTPLYRDLQQQREENPYRQQQPMQTTEQSPPVPQNLDIPSLISMLKNQYMPGSQQQQQLNGQNQYPGQSPIQFREQFQPGGQQQQFETIGQQQNQNPLQTPVYLDPQQSRQQQPMQNTGQTQQVQQNIDIPTLISVLENLYNSNPQQQQHFTKQNQFQGQLPLQFRELFQNSGQQQQFETNGRQQHQNPIQTPVYPDPQQQSAVNPYRQQQSMQPAELPQTVSQNMDISKLMSVLQNLYNSDPQQQQQLSGQNQYRGQQPLQVRELFQPGNQQQFQANGKQQNLGPVQNPVYPDLQQQVNPYRQQTRQSQPVPQNREISTLNTQYMSFPQQEQQFTGQNQYPVQVPLQPTEQLQSGMRPTYNNREITPPQHLSAGGIVMNPDGTDADVMLDYYVGEDEFFYVGLYTQRC